MPQFRSLPHLVAFLAIASALPSEMMAFQAIPTLHGDPVHPPATQNWVDTRLYFGLGPADAPNKGVTEAAWRAFLDQEVTPRFPAGLSVLDVYGQWQSKRGQTASQPERIRSKMLIIDYPATPENAAKVEAIRAAWKQRTGDQSVLRVTKPADISF
ncbi:DUF3574 domain-containing protein [Granulicella arctica]|uniref:DUF3574 domain-containing protein n=1 Tax=Granulicella arctica TaxID=940613 RepID=UPI0021E0773A|nr:DUF3574 domain-containing protein [Granulicella arctica]